MPRDVPSAWSLPEWLRSVRRRVAPARLDRLVEPAAGGESAFAHADNADRRVLSLLAPMLGRERCLLVTGYQDFLSAMSILLELRPGIAGEKEGTIRLIFGTNTDTTRAFGRGRTLAEEARRHYLGRSGLSLDHEGDLKAVLARDAIACGAIALRVYDRDRAAMHLGRAVPMMHAKAYIGESLAVIGSANFSRAGLRHNLELVEAIRPSEDSFAARRAWAERAWECGTDWSAEALEILDGLLRLVSPEEAVSRMLAEMSGFRPWRVDGNLLHTDTAPRPFQAELVYEANATIYEHGFSFIEAPTGAGKTEIGKHLGATLPAMHDQVVMKPDSDTSGVKRGAIAVVPPRVVRNWTTNAPGGLAIMKLSEFSRDLTDRPEEARALERRFETAAAMIVDECHRMNTRWLGVSRRAQVFEESPAIWSACLSATLLGNQSLDSLLTFHEKRASLFMSPTFTEAMNAIFARERERQRQGAPEEHDLFGAAVPLRAARGRNGAKGASDGTPLVSLEGQEDLARGLAPFLCRRNRACIGESGTPGDLRFPLIESHRVEPRLTRAQRTLIDEVCRLANRISAGQILSSPERSRLGGSRLSIHDIERITVRTLMSLLRTSSLFARWSWHHRTDPGALGASIGERLRRAESGSRKVIHDDAQEGLPLAGGGSPTPICDRIEAILANPALAEIDAERVEEMLDILLRHHQVVFLAERVGVLQIYAEHLKRRLDKADVFAVMRSPINPVLQNEVFGTSKVRFKPLMSGDAAQEELSLGGAKWREGYRAIFMTYEMAEGVNLQRAQALGMIGITSNIKNMIQGMGRIDRIDSPHGRIAYYTFDMPAVTLPSDSTARDRMITNLIAAGAELPGDAGGEHAPDALLEAPGALTERILAFKRSPRVLRREHLHDALGLLRQVIAPETLARVAASRPEGIWGAELCRLRPSGTPFTAYLLAGRAPGLGAGPDYMPPRLVAVAQDDGGTDGSPGSPPSGPAVMRGQVECANLILDAYRATHAAGLATQPGDPGRQLSILEDVQAEIAQLTHWDIRPERTVSLLASLARFLDPGGPEDAGVSLFGHLTLPALEYLASRWHDILTPAWMEAKRAIRETMTVAGAEPPDYLGTATVVEVFLSFGTDAAARGRESMERAVAAAEEASRSRATTIADRVAVIFRAAD